MSRRPAAPGLICVYCGEDVVFASGFLPTGAVCADCGAVPALGPTDHPINEATDLGSAPESQGPAPGHDNNGEAGTPSPSGERAATSPTRHPLVGVPGLFTAAGPELFPPPPNGSVLPCIEVEEWIFIDDGLTPYRTPRELFPGLRGPAFKVGEEISAFVLVLEHKRSYDSLVWRRDVGPVFAPCDGSASARAAALNAATWWGRQEAKRLKATGPSSSPSYRPAREIHWS